MRGALPVRGRAMAAKDGPTSKYFREEDIPVFKRAAKRFNVYIAVRRLNPESVK